MPRHKGPGSKPEWFDANGAVKQHALKSAEKETFIDWLAQPKHLREPASLQKMHEALDVSLQTLRAWKRDPRVQSKVRAKLQGQLTISELPDIIESLLTQAKDPENTRSVQASKLLIELMEKVDDASVSVPLADMTNIQLRDMAANLHDEFDERAETA